MLLKTIFAVPLSNVKPVVVPIFHAVPLPESVQVPEPIISVLVLVVSAMRTPAVTLKLLASKVPLERSKFPFEVNASCNWTVPPPFIVIAGNVFPLLVISCVPDVAEKVNALLTILPMPLETVILP